MLVFTAFGCGGQEVGSPAAVTTSYALTGATFGDESLIGDAFGQLVPALQQNVCPTLDATAFSPIAAIDSTGTGVVELTTPCFVIHVPVVVAEYSMNADGSGSFVAAVPAEDFITQLEADFAAEQGVACTATSVPAETIRAAANGYEDDDSSDYVAVISFQLGFTSRAVSTAPLVPAATCNGS